MQIYSCSGVAIYIHGAKSIQMPYFRNLSKYDTEIFGGNLLEFFENLQIHTGLL